MKNLIILISIFFAAQGVYAQKLDNSFFTNADQFFKAYVQSGKVDYASAKQSPELAQLIKTIGTTDLSSAAAADKKAFYINSYNLLVINTVASQFPLNSVLSVNGFFDSKKHKVAGESITLNKLEKDRLIKTTGDARLHFVLVCGAIDCPPIVNFAYMPGKLDAQMEIQTTKAMNNPNFIKISGNEVGLSKIFEWYVGDFGGNQKAVIEFINKYRETDITTTSKITYYEYDWNLNGRSAGTSSTSNPSTNDSAANASRYVVSAAIPKGGVELKMFNNLYTQKTDLVDNALTKRATFYTSTLSALYGINNRFNAGFELKYRRVNNDNLPSSALGAFNKQELGSGRVGITGVGPKVRIAPFPALKNFSVQSTFYIPIGEDLAGGEADPVFIDWNGAIWNTQLFNDFSIGNSFSIFTELDFLIEDIGRDNQNRFSTPVTGIVSYFPNPKTTLYVIGGFSPTWQSNFDYFAQTGVGAKYQITSDFELELLYTHFTNKGLLNNGGNAKTFNFGVRYNL